MMEYLIHDQTLKSFIFQHFFFNWFLNFSRSIFLNGISLFFELEFSFTNAIQKVWKFLDIGILPLQNLDLDNVTFQLLGLFANLEASNFQVLTFAMKRLELTFAGEDNSIEAFCVGSWGSDQEMTSIPFRIVQQ